MSKKELKVSRIKNGTVIDHIPAGRAMDVLRILKITGKEGFMVLIAMNVYSRKLKGKKDIIKIEGKFLSDKETAAISLVAPSATINIIKNGEVVEKKGVKAPQVVEGILKCPNPTCISRDEKESVKSKFLKVRESPLTYKCAYCNTRIEEKDIPKYLIM